MNDLKAIKNPLKAVGFNVLKNGDVKVYRTKLFNLKGYNPMATNGKADSATTLLLSNLNTVITKLLLTALEALITTGKRFPSKVIGRFLRKGVSYRDDGSVITTTTVTRLRNHLKDNGSIITLEPLEKYWRILPSESLPDDLRVIVDKLLKFFKLNKTPYAHQWKNINLQWGMLLGLAKRMVPVYNGIRAKKIKVDINLLTPTVNSDEVNINTPIEERPASTVVPDTSIPPWDVDNKPRKKLQRKTKTAKKSSNDFEKINKEPDDYVSGSRYADVWG